MLSIVTTDNQGAWHGVLKEAVLFADQSLLTHFSASPCPCLQY